MDFLTSNSPMPVLFIGHGSPMNTLALNRYTQTMREFGKKLPTPKAILCISAHWETRGTMLTSTDNPKQIYDFSGFPPELHKFSYPAKGSQHAAMKIYSVVEDTRIGFDNGEWGLDHGTWSVLAHLFPEANVPVLQLSLDVNKTPEEHFKLAQELSKLRDLGILIVGSGNIVHNLRTISWQEDAPAQDWAVQFDRWFKDNAIEKNYGPLVSQFHAAPGGEKSIPSLEHYLPALYILGASLPDDRMVFFNEEIQNASISMRSFIFETSSN